MFGGQRMSVTCGIEVFPSAIRLITVTVGLQSESEMITNVHRGQRCRTDRDEANLHWGTRMRIRKAVHHNTRRKHLLAFAFFWNSAAPDVPALWQSFRWNDVTSTFKDSRHCSNENKHFTLSVSKKTVHCNTYKATHLDTSLNKLDEVTYKHLFWQKKSHIL